MNCFIRLFITLALTAVAWGQSPEEQGNPANTSQGPDLMGRGDLRVGKTGEESTPLSVNMYVNGTYDSLLGSYAVDANGDPIQSGSYGVEGGVNARGQKQMKRSVLGMQYNGSYNYYDRLPQFNGTNQALTLGYVRRLTKRWDLASTNVGSFTNRVIGNPLNQQAGIDDSMYLPTTELFDSGVYFGQTELQANYAKSARWQYHLEGSGGLVRRKANGLADVNLYGSGAGASYRWSRRTTFSLDYKFGHFDFGRAFGESNNHGITVAMARQFGRNWQLELRLTGYQQHTTGVRQVALDPVIAALLGQGSGSEVYQSNAYLYGYVGRLERRFRQSEFSIRSERSIRPGNGLYLSTLTESHSANYSVRALRKWVLDAGVGWATIENIGGFGLGEMRSRYALVSVSRTLTPEWSLRGTAEVRSMDIRQNGFDRTGHRVTLGLSYTPNSLFNH